MDRPPETEPQLRTTLRQKHSTALQDRQIQQHPRIQDKNIAKSPHRYYSNITNDTAISETIQRSKGDITAKHDNKKLSKLNLFHGGLGNTTNCAATLVVTNLSANGYIIPRDEQKGIRKIIFNDSVSVTTSVATEESTIHSEEGTGRARLRWVDDWITRQYLWRTRN